jgi:Ni/Fe-hydrogenase 1 B-type cytochrome subunit
MLVSREKVFDPVLRSIHAWNGIAILLLVLSAQVASWLELTPEAAFLWRFHVWVGYALVVGLVARLSWGVHGPRYASWGAFWQPKAWWQALRSRQLFVEQIDYGHHPLAAAVYLVFYIIILVMAVTGLALAAIEQGIGPLVNWLGHDLSLKAIFKSPHDWLEEFVLGFIVIHIAALVLHEIRHGLPIAQAMISGYQYRKEE